jgi:tRNA (mo5U34)-methyltransferase
MTDTAQDFDPEITTLVSSVPWYHTIDLGHGIVTPGIYDHRPYLHHYHLPDNLAGKRVLDIGAASGFFSFEFERRGAEVTATDLPAWFDHDFGPNYRADQTVETGQIYLHQPIQIAKAILRSKINQKYLNIYDITPETVGGVFDLVFCGSLLIHLTDPIKALWRIASVTGNKAVIATVIMPDADSRPLALLAGERGDSWWLPNRTCLERMVVFAGFLGLEWVGDFVLNYRDGSPGPYHGVLHAYNTLEDWTPNTMHRDMVLEQHQATIQAETQHLLPEAEANREEIARLKQLVDGYERGRFIRFMRWVNQLRRNKLLARISDRLR